MEMVLASASYSILIASSGRSLSTSGSATAWNLILSSASEAFEISSLRKISFYVYREFIKMSMRRPISA